MIDDGSRDESYARIAALGDPRIRLVYQPNRGPGAARNLGVALARSEFVALQDADDLSLPHRLAAQREALLAHPEWAAVGSGYTWIDEDGREVPWRQPWEGWPPIDEIEPWLFGCPFFPSATLLRRDAYLTVGGMERDLRGGEDWNLWLKLLLAGYRLGWHRDVVCRYRVASGSLSNQARTMARDCPLALQRILDDPRFPEALRDQGRRALALRHLDGFKRLFLAGLWPDGSSELERALALDPSLARGRPSRLEDEIVISALSPMSADPARTLDAFLTHLASEQSAALSADHLRWRLALEHRALGRTDAPNIASWRVLLGLPTRLGDRHSRAYLRRALANRLERLVDRGKA